MRLKYGDTWFDVSDDIPIMIQLTEKDKENIASMHPEATKYAIFSDNSKLTNIEKYDWMGE